MDMAGQESPLRSARLRSGIVVATVVVIVGLMATLVSQPWVGSGGSTSPSPLPSSAEASPSPAPPSTASPDEAWSDLDLQPLGQEAVLTADRLDAAGIEPDATFALTSLGTASAVSLARRIAVSPETDLDVRPGTDAFQATIAPRADLAAGTVYRFTLRSTDGSLAGSWAFRVRGPLHVVGTLPGDRSTGVPVRTGVEVTFDQEGAADIAPYFSIAPAAAGHFERHGLTQVFVPDGLAAGTLYTVTIKAGLPRNGTDLTLAADVVFRFETQDLTAAAPWLRPTDDLIEASPTDRPIVGVQAVVSDLGTEDTALPTTASVRVYRFRSLADAETAMAAFVQAPRWTEHAAPLMPTEGLPVVATFRADVRPITSQDPWTGYIRLPEPLATGWYVVEIEGQHPSQAFLQVTPVAAWVAVLTDRTVVWANDVATTKPIAAASVSLVGGATMGTTDATGLLVAATPSVLLPATDGTPGRSAEPPLVSVRSPAGAVVLVATSVGPSIPDGKEWWDPTPTDDSSYWSLLLTDRAIYRTTDRVSTWGYLQRRDGRAAPSSVELRLSPAASDSVEAPPAVATATVRPDATGAFSASLPFAQLPLGSYQLQAVVDGTIVATRWVSVTVIRKPVYQLALTPDHLAVVTGAKVRWTTEATFFDGTPVPSLVAGWSDDEGATGTFEKTDGSGTATIDRTLRSPSWANEDGDASSYGLWIHPAGQEEAEISATASVLVFPAHWYLAADGVVAGRRLTVTGSLATVDLEKVDAALKAGTYDGDPTGHPVAGRTVRATVTELVPVRHQVGTDYDFIDKVSRPRYEYDTVRRVVATLTVRSGSDGAFRLALTVPDPAHEYEIALRSTDGAGLGVARTIVAGTEVDQSSSDAGLRFVTPAGEEAGPDRYSVGDEITWRMTDDGKPLAPDATDRYLYIVAQRGLRAATVSADPSFRRTFGTADAPGIEVLGVRFTGGTYVEAMPVWAAFDSADRRIVVTVTTDQARYRPGDAATLTVRTVDAQGRPVAASVLLEAVDEKLYAIGGAEAPQPLSDLYRAVPTGIVERAMTHQAPGSSDGGGGGDVTGGGGRDDFEDTLAFRTLSTGSDGRASLTIPLSDDLTSWHVSAIAVTSDLQVGVAERIVPVGLPAFVDATIADEYLVTDHPTIRLRAYGDGLRAGDPVRFTIAAPSLGLAPTTIEGTAFSDVSFPLPSLRLGTQRIELSLVAPTRTDAAGRPLTDRLIRTFSVVASRLTSLRTVYGVVGGSLPTAGGADAATYTFTDAGRGRYLPVLLTLADPPGARLDRLLAQVISHDLLVDAFGRDPATVPPATFDATLYPPQAIEDENGVVRAGIPLLPYGGTDPWLAARVAILAPDRVEAQDLRAALVTLRGLDSTPRDLWIAATAGLAALGEPVLGDLQDARTASDLTITEQLYLALGFAAVGDDASALAIERELLSAHGERLGPWVRLQAGDLEATADATALMAVLAGSLGDPLTPDLIDEVVAHPSTETTHALDVAAATSRILDRTPTAPASFAYTVDGDRTTVSLEPGEAVSLTLTADQRTGLRLERLSGSIGVAIAWRDAVDPTAIATDPDTSLVRMAPTTAPTDDLVTVDLRATFDPTALESGCYAVDEVVPSGLAPLADWRPDSSASDVIWPSIVVGQRVTFCVPNPGLNGSREGHLRYVARVVNAGTFTWEPAVMQPDGVGERVALTSASTIRIGD